MWRVKYSRASVLNSGSGDVMATWDVRCQFYRVPLKNVHASRSPYKVQQRAGQNAVYGEADASLHEEQTLQTITLQKRLLQPTDTLGGGVTQRHVHLPASTGGKGFGSEQLRSMQHDDAQVEMQMHVCHKVRRHPWRRAVRGKADLQIWRQILQPFREG